VNIDMYIYRHEDLQDSHRIDNMKTMEKTGVIWRQMFY
jgi:hypothetical protein